MLLFSGSSAFPFKALQVFDLGHDHYYYDDFSNESIMRKVADSVISRQ